mgnify:CR=1 FL=1
MSANSSNVKARSSLSVYRISQWFWTLLANGLLIAGVLIFAIPFIYMISASFKPQNEIFTFPIQILPNSVYEDGSLYPVNYVKLFSETRFVRWFLNTFLVAASRLFLSLILCLLAGFAFAKYEFRFKNFLFVFLLASLTLPFEIVLVPLYKMMVDFGWINSYWPLIVPFAANAFGIFLARQYCLSFPSELMEAARIDGSSEIGIFFRIALPNLKPAIAVLGIIFFNGAWNDFLWPIIINNDQDYYVINQALPTLRGPYGDEYGLVLAGAVLATIPVILIFAFMQRYFIEGLMAGAVKG